jgi:hypothetical protein
MRQVEGLSKADQENIRAKRNELLEGDVETMESHKSRDQKLAKDKRVGVFTER